MTPQHILVPTDFSDTAADALDYATQLANALQARLTLLYALHLSSLALGEASPVVLDSTYEAMQSRAQQQLQLALDRVHQVGVEGNTVIVEGIPFQVILDTW